MNYQQQLRELFAKKKQQSEDSVVAWEVKQATWITAVTKLYQQVTKWLSPLAKEGIISIHRQKITLDEYYLSPYEIDQLEIRAGNERVYLKPQGAIIANAAGRIDLIGEAMSVKLLLLPTIPPQNFPKSETLAWFVMPPYPLEMNNSKKLPKLTLSTFAEILFRVMSQND